MHTLSLVLMLAMQASTAVQAAPMQRAHPAAATPVPALSTGLPPAAVQAAVPEPTSPLTPEEITAVPAELDDFMVRAQIVRGMSREQQLQHLVEFVFGAHGLALEYDARTRTISESIRDHKANCVSFALIFMTLAREAGLDAYLQESDRVVAWYASDALYSYGHVNVGVKTGFTRRTVDIDSSVLMSSGKPRAISDQRALAHFYNNRGAELMEDGRLDQARTYLDTALAMEPGFVPALNNYGVLEMRAGLPRIAEQHYLAVIAIDPKHLPALSNLVNLYRQTGAPARARAMEKRLFSVERRDPFYQVVQAISHERSGDYAKAVGFYRRAIRLMGREHHLYFGLARSYAHLGDIGRAKEALIQARNASEDDQHTLYQAKLDKLSLRAAY